MPDLLLELFSEEIPARMQAKAADDLRRMVTDKLVAEGLIYEGAKAFATPRRLALTVHGIPARQPDLKEERKGPRVGGAEAAIAGFLKATGLARIEDAKIQRDPKKGDFYIALIEKPGRATLEVFAEILPVIIRTFPWPKSMRWGERSARPGALNWVRPLHSIIATFGIDTEDPDVVKFAIDDIEVGQTTRGHRFMAPAAISVRRFEDYEAKLKAAKVVLDPQARKDIILADARTLAQAQNLELVEDQVLLDEVAGLVEWPVALMGSFDRDYLAIPGEVIRATIRNNQKCFVVNDPKTGKLTNKFILTANIEASDGGKAIAAGNERVIRARLADAKFFYETDLRNWKERSVDQLLKKFDNMVFHEKLGSESEHVKRIERLAVEIAPVVGADVEKVRRAAQLAKADRLSEVVGEFPELQGLMGRHYALTQGEDAAVAATSEEHYKPQGPADRVPSDPVSVAVALADKIDSLVGFWTIDEKPSGRGDQYGLRRAALGVIRLILSSSIRIKVADLVRWSVLTYILYGLRPERGYRDLGRSYIPPDEDGPSKSWWEIPYKKLINYDGFFDSESNSDGAAMAQIGFPNLSSDGDEEEMAVGQAAYDELYSRLDKLDSIATISGFVEHDAIGIKDDRGIVRWFEERPDYQITYGRIAEPIYLDLLGFFADRLKVQLREQGARHDLVDAVFSLGDQDDLLMVVRRVEALGKFLDTDDGKNLLAGTKRAANILRIEEKKDGKVYDGPPDPALMTDQIEKHLWGTIQSAVTESSGFIKSEDFEMAMESLSTLRSAVDAFFDKVKVNDDEPKVRENRLKLLNEIRAATRAVADFSKIQD